MGNAVVKACRDIKEQAAARWRPGRSPSAKRRSRSATGRVRVAGRELSYEELLQAHFGPPRGEVIGVGEGAQCATIPSHPLGGRPAFWELMCAAAEVEVDPETGMVRIAQARAGQRHRQGAEPAAGRSAGRRRGRDGAGAHASWSSSCSTITAASATSARSTTASRRFRTPPRALHSILIENDDGPGPFGAKGAGEGGILAIAAAVGAAVNQAAGVSCATCR